MVAAFITLPARTNIGIASSTLSWNAELSVWSTIRPMSCRLAHRYTRPQPNIMSSMEKRSVRNTIKAAAMRRMGWRGTIGPSAQHVGALVGPHHRDLVAPPRAGKAEEFQSSAHDHRDPEHYEAGIDDVEPPLQRIGAFAPEEAHEVVDGRQRHQEHHGDE